MGFDLYGVGQNFVGKKPEIDWDTNPSEKERDQYFDSQQEFEENNPGYYFRNNAWYWRPLWHYICIEVAPDILSEEDKKSGDYNDGHLIDATKAIHIADQIDKLDKEGVLDAYEKDYDKSMSELPDEECDLCKGTGIRHIHQKCNGCNGKGKRKSFVTNYPFIADNVRKFGQFARASGGFEIL